MDKASLFFQRRDAASLDTTIHCQVNCTRPVRQIVKGKEGKNWEMVIQGQTPKYQHKIPPKIPGQSREKSVYVFFSLCVFFCFFAPIYGDGGGSRTVNFLLSEA